MHWRKVLLWTLSAAILTAPVYLSGINVTAAPIMQENKTEVDKIKEEKKEPVSGYEEEFQKNNEKVSETMKNKKVSRTAQNESCGETATWALDNGVLTISGTGAIADYSDTSEIPWKDQKKTITKIVIENGITEIGIQAFYDCTNVTEVVFPDTLTTIKRGAFFQCYSLEAAILPDGVTTLEQGAFAKCSSMMQYSGKGVTSYGQFAFQDTALSSFEIPKGVADIESLVFLNCGIEEYTLAEGNETYMVKDGILFSKSGDELVIYPAEKKDETYRIPEGCTKIADYAFRGVSRLKTVDLGKITTLGEGAFYSASLTGELVLPDSLTTLEGYFTFEACRGLTSVKFGDGLKQTVYRMFEDCSGLTAIDFGDALDYLEMRTFLGCNSLKEVTLPDRMTDWGGSVFNSCKSLITFRSENLKEVGYADFAQCYDLEHVYLGKVEKINRQAFTYCNSLEEITLPATTQWVDENAFPQGVKITCENKELIPFGNNGLHRAEYVSISGTRDYQKAYEVLALVNAERKKAGLGELKMEKSLLDTAMVRAEEQAVLFSHTRPNGTSCFSANAKMVAENVAIGSTTSDGVMDQWMNSSGHKANILLEKANTIGIGCYYIDGGYTWVQVFSDETADADCTKLANKDTTAVIEIPGETFSEAANTPGIIWGGSEKYTYELAVQANSRMKLNETQNAEVKLVNPGFKYFVISFKQDGIIWNSDNPSIASVDANGKITANGNGTAVISAKTKYYTGTLKIQVGETGGSGSDNGNTGETGGPGNDNGNGNSWWDLIWGWNDKLTTSQPEDSQTKPQQTIKVGKPKISLKRSKTKIQVQFKKVKNAKKYQIQYATNKKFKKAKSKTTTKLKYTIKGLKKNKKYYVRVRGVNGKKKGSWSAVKKK